MNKTIALLVAMMWASHAIALEAPENGATDARIKTILFREHEVVRVAASYYRETMIVFHPDEVVDYTGTGYLDAWEFDKEENILTLKPKRLSTVTTNLNMLGLNARTGVTRYYSFLLDIVDTSKEAPTWQLHFRYPAEERALAAWGERRKKQRAEADISNPGGTRAEDWNDFYGYSGDEALAPRNVKDNGTFTYFRFKKGNRTPAIYAVNDDGSHNLVDHHLEGNYVVVRRLAPSFVMRLGKLTTYVFRTEDE